MAMIAAAAAAAGAKLQRRRGPSALGASVLTALLAGAAALWVLFDTRINDPTLAALLFGDSLDPVAFAPAGWAPALRARPGFGGVFVVLAAAVSVPAACVGWYFSWARPGTAARPKPM